MSKDKVIETLVREAIAEMEVGPEVNVYHKGDFGHKRLLVSTVNHSVWLVYKQDSAGMFYGIRLVVRQYGDSHDTVVRPGPAIRNLCVSFVQSKHSN